MDCKFEPLFPCYQEIGHCYKGLGQYKKAADAYRTTLSVMKQGGLTNEEILDSIRKLIAECEAMGD